MDTSETYEKMCDCPEIQDGWEPKVGDWTDKGIVWNFELDNAELGNRKPYGAYIVTYDDRWARRSGEFYSLKQLIFKPRQGQLQGMLNEDGFRTWSVQFDACRAWFIKTNHEYIISSMEQLWLAFVMWELYSKKWDGEKWILTK